MELHKLSNIPKSGSKTSLPKKPQFSVEDYENANAQKDFVCKPVLGIDMQEILDWTAAIQSKGFNSTFDALVAKISGMLELAKTSNTSGIQDQPVFRSIGQDLLGITENALGMVSTIGSSAVKIIGCAYNGYQTNNIREQLGKMYNIIGDGRENITSLSKILAMKILLDDELMGKISKTCEKKADESFLTRIYEGNNLKDRMARNHLTSQGDPEVKMIVMLFLGVVFGEEEFSRQQTVDRDLIEKLHNRIRNQMGLTNYVSGQEAGASSSDYLTPETDTFLDRGDAINAIKSFLDENLPQDKVPPKTSAGKRSKAVETTALGEESKKSNCCVVQ